MRAGPSTGVAFIHIAALTTLAVAQPLFDLLGRNPEFFAARGSSAFDIVTFALITVIVPPVAIVAVELIVGLVSRVARDAVHLACIAVLLAVVVIQPLKRALDAGDPVLVGIPLAIGVAVAVLYRRAAPVRSFFTVLGLAPVVFLVLFLCFSPVSKLTLVGEASARDVTGGSRAPIVFLGLDEFPGIDLLDGHGRLDARRYPAFAELASRATTFPNAHSVYDSTSRAWPAIMDGDYPRKDRLPTSADHPNSMFAILGKTHRMNVSEEATSVCPRSLCNDTRFDLPYADRMTSMIDDLSVVYRHLVYPPRAAAALPSVADTWGDFDGSEGGGPPPDPKESLQGNRGLRLDRWIASIRDSAVPTLNFKHVLLPHVPWQYLPDGRRYNRSPEDPITGLSRDTYRDAGQTVVLQQRHLLQAGFADRELGKLIAHLKRVGLWDKAMVVVTADHGVSFRRGQFDRRLADAANIDEIAPVPLFIKAPGQRRPSVNPAVVETVDVLPTMLDLLHIDPKVRMDGRSAFSRAVRGRTHVKFFARDLSRTFRVPQSRFAEAKRAAIARRIARFGDDGRFGDRFYRTGPARLLPLIGTRARPVGVSAAKVSFTDPAAFERVDHRSSFIPSWVTGRVTGARTPTDIAVAVNGTVCAVGTTLRMTIGGDPVFGAMVPERRFRQGANRVELFEVDAGRLLRVPR